MRTFGLILRPAGALLAFAFSGGVALAQTPAAAPAAAAPAANMPTYGPPLTGVCVFSRDMALNTSAAGVSVNTQLQQMEQSANATLAPQRDALAAEDKALSAEKAKLTPAKFQERVAALQQRAQAYSQTVQSRNAQFSQAHDKAQDQIAQAVTPLLVASITAHACSLIVERNSIYGANPAMDLTPEVIQKLNAALPTVTVVLGPAPTGQP
ncbi:MAG TPA: OmpH family outer membrane protein [Caulobacteraceae bacterium]|nr:OmpH family outer membrane protein [Caulobacteraceae bacterium]